MTEAEREELRAYAAGLVDRRAATFEEKVAVRLAMLERQVAAIEQDRMAHRAGARGGRLA